MISAVRSSLLVVGLASLSAAQWSECHKLLPNGGLGGDSVGSDVATDGSLVVVGAPDAKPSGATTGAAYVFGKSGAQLLSLLSSDAATGDRFGTSVAVEGPYVVVGAPSTDAMGQDSGAAYVFDSSTGLELMKLEASDGASGLQFGYDVALDSGLLVVGALGAAYVFDVSTGQELVKLEPAGSSPVGGFGEAVDIDAGLVVVGARLADGVSGFSGAAYLFDAASGNQLHELLATNGTVWAFFGACVSIEGDVIAIGAPMAGPNGKQSGAAYQFDATTGQQTRVLVPGDGHIFAQFGSSVSTDGQQLVVGSDQNNANAVFSCGAVYVYEAQSGALTSKLIASDSGALDEFGGAVALAGDVLVAGAARNDDLGENSGSAYVFDGNGCLGLGDSYCDSNPNSSGATAALTASGSPMVSLNDVTFEVDSLPTNRFGYFLMSDTQAFVPLFGGSQGNLCLGGQIIRFDQDVLNSSASGAVSFSPDLTDLPQGAVISPGETWSFQYWTRDVNPAQTSNTSNGLEIQFQ